MPEIPDCRQEERAYQEWAAEFDRRRREIEREGLSPEEAGYRLLSEIGEFRFSYRTTLHGA